MSGKRPGRQFGRSNVSHENDGEFLWLVSLSDLMILLFVFFVVLFSVSYKKVTQVEFQQTMAVIAGEKNFKKPLDDVQKTIAAEVVKRGLQGMVDVIQKDDALILNINDVILFESASYRLKDESHDVLLAISKALEAVPVNFRLGIEGHTDDVPINMANIVDNWQLSLLRAHSVFEALELEAPLAKRTVLMGYGQMNPLVPNRDGNGKGVPANRGKNRRVTLRVF